jgi:NAD(P)-dependent dehydrogenase (short-subunit alcohol dehydrogenase family)
MLDGASVVIIGGSSGMGLATARLVREQGGDVTIASRSRTKLANAAQLLGRVRTVVADLTSESDVQALFAQLERVDHVFVPAGRMLLGKVVEADLETLRADVAQRFWGPLYVVRSATTRMTGGSLTFLSGLYASKPSPGAVVTAALNAAVEVLAKGLARELSPIRVNAIAPGLIDTPVLGDHRDGAARWAETTLPVRRMGLAEEVAQAALFLMTNGFITGEVVHVDGGGRLV